MYAAGLTPANGKRKGGVKVHIGMKLQEDVPSVVRITSSATHDTAFLRHIGRLSRGTILVFDKAYVDFKLFNQWTQDGIIWVSRLKKWFVVTPVEEIEINEESKQKGVVRDQVIELGHSTQKEKVKCRLVTFYDQEKRQTFEFICNDLEKDSFVITQIYKQRWQIELLFKRLKQNFQIGSFLGDNENAIKVQIYCALIADLLLKLISRSLKRRWAFSNLAAIVRLHLMNYTDLRKFLENPERCAVYNPAPQNHQLKLFSSA